jgi:hypothetical protein
MSESGDCVHTITTKKTKKKQKTKKQREAKGQTKEKHLIKLPRQTNQPQKQYGGVEQARHKNSTG